MKKNQGGIGNAEQIFDAIINTGLLPNGKEPIGLLVSPPSSVYLHDLSAVKIRTILEMIEQKKLKPINIVFAISNTKIKFVENNKLLKYKKKEVTIKGAFYFETSYNSYKLISKPFDNPKKYWTEFYF